MTNSVTRISGTKFRGREYVVWFSGVVPTTIRVQMSHNKSWRTVWTISSGKSRSWLMRQIVAQAATEIGSRVHYGNI